MAEGDEVYVTVAQAIPYVNYVATAYKIVKEIFEFGKESEEQRAIRDLQNRVAALEQAVPLILEWLNEVEVRVAQGVLYGIDAAGDLYWHRHSTWPTPSTQLEGPVKIGNGWAMFTRVFSLGAGFLCGVRPNGEMLLYHFTQWRWGPGNAAPVWHGPVKVPGTHWRRFRSLSPSVGDAPVIIP
jgi:hypothetical protein